MPTNRFAANFLQGATPGLSKIAAALGGGQSAYDAGADQENSRQSKMAQALAAMRASDASAAFHNAGARQSDAETSILSGRQGLGEEQVAFGAGTDIPTVRAIRQMKATGQAPQVPMGPAAEDGGMGVGSQQFDPGLVSKVAQALQSQIPLMSSLKDLNAEQLAKARTLDRSSALSDAIIAGRADRNTVGGAQAAVEAKPLFHVSGDGGVLDQYSGGLNESGGLAQSTIGLKKAQSGAQVAQAANSYAGADAHRASAAKTRADISEGVRTGAIQVITDNDGNVSLLNKATGISRPATSADGVPLIGKSMASKLKDVPPTVNAKIIEGQQGLTNIDSAIKAVQANKGAFGLTNAIPFVERMRQGDAQGVDARAQVANIGSLTLHDRSGAAVSASEFPRLAPFIPSSSDSPEAIVTKLQKMKQIAEGELGLYLETYGEGSGHKPNAVLRRRATDIGAVPDDIAAILKKHGGK